MAGMNFRLGLKGREARQVGNGINGCLHWAQAGWAEATWILEKYGFWENVIQKRCSLQHVVVGCNEISGIPGPPHPLAFQTSYRYLAVGIAAQMRAACR